MLLAIAAYLVAHFAAYVLVLRHRAGLRSEKGIFVYHFASAVFAGLAGVAFAVLEPDRFGLSGLVLVLSLHGIYSLSFLELWSLAQGGYSLSILASIAQAQASGSAPDFGHLERIGGEKQRNRLAVLGKLGLIEKRDGAVGLNARGRSASAVLLFVMKWIDPKPTVGER